MLIVRAVPHGDADLTRLWEAMWAELEERYGFLRGLARVEADEVIACFVGYIGDEPTGTVTIRFASFARAAPVAEVKRMYVVPEARGRGYSRVLMGAAENAARRAGAIRIVLETGSRQPEAIGLYKAIGYSVVPNFGPWVDSAESICMVKELPTRVLVISGSLGAGKTTVAWAASDLLSERKVRHAVIEGDALAQGEPPPLEDTFNQELMFRSLAAIAPLYRERGWGCIVVPRVVEDDGDRKRYAQAFAGPAGLAEVGIVRLVAPEEVRKDRLRHREAPGRWLDWALGRTVELEEALEEAGVEDAAIESGGDAKAIATEVLEAVGWA